MTPTTYPHFDTQLAVHQTEICNLKATQASQADFLVRIESKVDGLKNWIMGAVLTGALGVLAAAVQIVVTRR